jgi:hypothetical protein
MLASPETFLIMCIREKNFEKCQDVITFFNMNEKQAEIAFLTKEFQSLVHKLNQTALTLTSDIGTKHSLLLLLLFTNDCSFMISISLFFKHMMFNI